MPDRVVVRGLGSIGVRHARVAAALGCSVGVWPVRPTSRAVEPGTRLLDDAQGMAAVASADLVIVATDTARHVPDALEALEAGAARVLLEKPVAPTVAASRDLEEHGLAARVMVAAPLRAHSAFQHVTRMLPELGSHLSAHVWCQSWLPDWRRERDYRSSYSADPEQGGVLRDLVHELDYLTVLFGKPRLLGSALDHTGPLEIAAEQAATLLLETPTAPAITVRLDYITRPPTRGIVIRGTTGSLQWSVTDHRVDFSDAAGAVRRWDFPEDADRDAIMAAQLRAALSGPEAARRLPGAPATLAEGLTTLALCDEARERSRQTASPQEGAP